MITSGLLHAIMNFTELDRIPVWLIEVITGQAERKRCRGEDFRLDKSGTDGLEFDSRLLALNIGDQPLLPTFLKKAISKDDRYVISQDVFGYIKQQPRGSSISPTHYIYTGAPLDTIED